MYSYYTTTYSGRTMHIIKGQSDANENIQISVLAVPYSDPDPLKLASDFSDGYLESNGWTKIGVVNGGLFFSGMYANGIEKAFWTVNENDDPSWDGVMGIGHTGADSNSPIIETQASIKNNWGGYRGAITGAFGLLRNGVVDQGNTSTSGVYSVVSGRTIIGKDGAGATYLISTPGVTGSSGLTGAQCLAFAQSIGLTDALVMDGGGSVSMIYQGVWKVSTSRQIKNVVAMYVKAVGGGGGGGGGGTTTNITHLDQYVPFYTEGFPHQVRVNGKLTELVDIKVKKGTELISINDITIKQL